MVDSTPYEQLKGRKPSVDHLKVFVGHVKPVKPNLKKFIDRIVPMVYLGTESGSKGSRMYDVINNKIVISRDVHFQEDKKWDWSLYMGNFSDASSSWTSFYVVDRNDPAIQQHPESDEPTTASADGNGSSGHNEATTSNGIRRSSRASVIPAKLKDFVLEESLRQRIEQEEECVHVELLLTQGVLQNYKEAVGLEVWKMAMDREMQAIERNKTWVLVDRPAQSKPIGLKWLFKRKPDATSLDKRHKARLVAKGYAQRYGVDFDETFAPVARIETIRLILALSAILGWKVYHMDVTVAFLHGTLKEKVYVEQPQGYELARSERKVYKLVKALYGLKQAPRAWNQRLDEVLLNLGFIKCQREAAFYVRAKLKSLLVLGVYVDDLLVVGSCEEEVIEFKHEMSLRFEMKDVKLLFGNRSQSK